MPGPRPIFVLGLQRSGTTWIGNLLAAHPQVAAVTAARHRGIHESLFFSHFARAWDWSDPAQRSQALAAFLSSDYGRLLNLTTADRRDLSTGTTAAQVFRLAMDRFAARNGAIAWVEKTPHHVRHALEIAEAFPEARFVTIRRDSAALIESRRAAYGRQPKRGPRAAPALIRGALSNALHGKLLDRLARAHPERSIPLDYDSFKAGGDSAVARLLSRLGLPDAPGLASAFAPNSSFAALPRAAAALGIAERRLVQLTERAGQSIPLALLDQARRRFAREPVVFPAWTWPGAAPGDVRLAAPRPVHDPHEFPSPHSSADQQPCRE